MTTLSTPESLTEYPDSDVLRHEYYSRLQHVAMAVFMGRWMENDIAMFTAYFDESGSASDTPVVAVAGFLASSGQWIELERNWREACSAFGVSALHMREFAHSKGEYRGWKNDETLRARFIARLVNILKTRVLNSFASVVVMNDYEEAASQYRGLRMRPYTLAASTCIDKVKRWATRHGIDESTIAYVFEDGAEDQGEFARQAKAHLKVNPIFLEKAKSVAFQAADLLAYEYLKANKKIYSTVLRSLDHGDLRRSLQALREIPHGVDEDDWGVHDRDSLAIALEMEE